MEELKMGTSAYDLRHTFLTDTQENQNILVCPMKIEQRQATQYNI